MNPIIACPTKTSTDPIAALGITREIIAKYCHVVAMPVPIRYKPGWRIAQNERRAARRAAGCNVVTGQPLQRSPNGTRKPRKTWWERKAAIARVDKRPKL